MEPSDLYGLPLERFVAERTALARSLRKDGRRQEAGEVAALRKPSVAAWAVNQLVRTQPQLMDALGRAGEALREAHADILAGRGGGNLLREALARERDAVSELVEKARGLLTSEGHELTPATLERVSETLHAAALDQEARVQVHDGCLHRELRHVGLGSAEAVTPAPPARGSQKRSDRDRADRDRADRTRVESDQAAREAAERLHAAQTTEAQARLAAERTAGELEAAEQRRDLAAAELQGAEAALELAQRRAKEAAEAHRHAQAALERI